MSGRSPCWANMWVSQPWQTEPAGAQYPGLVGEPVGADRAGARQGMIGVDEDIGHDVAQRHEVHVALSLLIDGPAEVGHALTHLSTINLLSTLYTALLALLVGYGIWNLLLGRYPASEVAPFSLLVPAVGILTARLVDGERLTPPALVGAVLLVAGVALVSLGPRLLARFRPQPAS